MHAGNMLSLGVSKIMTVQTGKNLMHGNLSLVNRQRKRGDLRLPRGIHGQSVSNIPGLEAIF